MQRDPATPSGTSPRISGPGPDRSPLRGRPGWLLLVDLGLVLLFVLLGRRAHAEGSFVLGTLGVVWPFWIGCLAGWSILVLARRPAWLLSSGVVVAIATVGIGMVLRHLSGGGVQPSFVAVATTVVMVFLVGSRWVVQRRMS